jgi:hypothetical protein
MAETKLYTEIVRSVENASCVVFDLDATLCDHGSQADWTTCDEFVPIEPIVELARMVKNHGFDVVIATARPDKYVHQTIAWLDKYVPGFNGLYMKSECEANGSTVKNDQLLAIEEHWDICFWVDDSPFNAEVVRDHAVVCLRPTHNDAFWASYGNA